MKQHKMKHWCKKLISNVMVDSEVGTPFRMHYLHVCITSIQYIL